MMHIHSLRKAIQIAVLFVMAIGAAAGDSSTVSSTVLGMQLPQPWDPLDLTTIVRDNLEPDVAFWQTQQRQASVQDLVEEAARNPSIRDYPNTGRLVELRNSQARFPLLPPGPQQVECEVGCDPQMAGLLEGIRAGAERFNISWPDVVFLVNVNNGNGSPKPLVESGQVRAPIISISKDDGEADLLGPVLRPQDTAVVNRSAPWADKKDVAFFRGVPSCGAMPFPMHCARSWVARLATRPEYQGILDAGLIEQYYRPDQIVADPVLRDGNGPLPVLGHVPMEELPKYKWLLNLDGHTAAYRLAQLLAVNSLVLKQQSPRREFYYRSLQPYVHYVPIFNASQDDLLPALRWAQQHEAEARAIVAAANAFALRYTTLHARLLYLKYVLLAYRRLVRGMDEYFAAASGNNSSTGGGSNGSIEAGGNNNDTQTAAAAAAAAAAATEQQVLSQYESLLVVHKQWAKHRRQRRRQRQPPVAEQPPAPPPPPPPQQQKQQQPPGPDGDGQGQQTSGGGYLQGMEKQHRAWLARRKRVAAARQQQHHHRHVP